MNPSIIILALIINGIISVVVANAAKQRQIGSLKVFLISFLLTPILGMFVTAMSPRLTEEEINLPIQQSENDANVFLLFASVFFIVGIIGVLYF